MHQQRGAGAVVMAHDAEALLERGAVVLCGHSFAQVVNQGEVGVEELF